jgi:hypothetical protein
MIFKNILAEKCSENFGFFAQSTASLCKKNDHNIGF